ncbi:MAG: hypothetical protein AAF429_15525 [Pseudomonadota bacterium]
MACVLFSGGQLKLWRGSEKAMRDFKAERSVLKRWLELYQPDTVVMEDSHSSERKGERQKTLLANARKTIERLGFNLMLVQRSVRCPNVTELCENLAKRYPAIAHLVPRKPKIWESEQENVTLFEALNLADIADAKNL